MTGFGSSASMHTVSVISGTGRWFALPKTPVNCLDDIRHGQKGKKVKKE